MKKKIVLFASIAFILIIVDVLIIRHYASWQLPGYQVGFYGGFLVVAEIVAVWSLWKYNQVINPFTIYSIFIYTAGFSFLNLSERQKDYSDQFIILLIASMFFFISGGMISSFTQKIRVPKIFRTPNPSMQICLLIVFLLTGIGVFVMEIKQLGYLPIFNLSNMSVYQDLNDNAVTPLHNFIVLNAILPAISYSLYKQRHIQLFLFVLLCSISCFILLNLFTRQMIILLFFSMIVAVNYYGEISVVRLSIIGAICIIVFVTLGELRSKPTEGSNITSINEVLKSFTGITKDTNLLETYLSLYGGVNFTTGNQLVKISVEDGYQSWGRYTFRPFFSILPVNSDKMYPEKYSSHAYLGTYLVDPFLDFRWPGVAILNFIYGFLSVNSFKNYLARKSPYYIVEWSLFMFCLFMCSFTNYFHLFFVVFLFFINRIVVR